MNNKITAVLNVYHELIREERSRPREAPLSGRDSGQDRRLRAISPETGRLLNIIVKSL